MVTAEGLPVDALGKQVAERRDTIGPHAQADGLRVTAEGIQQPAAAV